MFVMNDLVKSTHIHVRIKKLSMCAKEILPHIYTYN